MRDYTDPLYKEWRLKVYKRDRFRCQMPGCTSHYHIQAHHIRRWSDAPELRLDPHNGITLCQNCHLKVTGAENNYIDMFERIVLEKEFKKKDAAKNVKSFIRIRKAMLGDNEC